MLSGLGWVGQDLGIEGRHGWGDFETTHSAQAFTCPSPGFGLTKLNFS